MRLTTLIPALLALGLGLALTDPGRAFSLGGSSLGLGQRDFRVFNNFTDLGANDNQTPDPSFPGHQGAVMAIWKASVEWSSALHGDGSGDPHQPLGLGSGGAAFDPTFQGEALDVGTVDGNVHSELQGSSGGIYAFTEIAPGGGWRIRYYAAWSWDDGPGTAVAGIDLQGVATHEYGHALGLGHSSVAGATMAAGFLGTGVSLRSIEADDQAGVQAIYGVAGAGKPLITGASLSGSQLTLQGTGFGATGNQVWFTQAGPSSGGDPLKLTGVPSAGGALTVTVPVGAGSGDVLVLGPGGSQLSNPWPLDLGAPSAAPTITGVLPASVPALVVDGAALVSLTGSGFSALTSLRVDGQVLAAGAYQVFGDNLIQLSMPQVSKLGSVVLEAVTTGGTGPATIDVTAVPPILELNDSSPGQLIQAQGIRVLLGGAPQDVLILAVSPSLKPTSLPGIIDLAIGNGFSSLYLLGTYAIQAKGWNELVFQTGGFLPPGTQLHMQAAAFTAASGYQKPGTATNVQSAVVLL